MQSVSKYDMIQLHIGEIQSMKEDRRIYILKEEKPAVAVLKLGLPLVTGTLANIALDPLFIFGFHLEIRGAAIATILSVWMLVYVIKSVSRREHQSFMKN